MTKAKLNTQIDAYLIDRPYKEHELEMLDTIKADHQDFSGSFLDLGCAGGSFIQLMLNNFPNAEYTGIDISEKLILQAKSTLSKFNINFQVADVEFWQPEKDKKFDIIHASGILGGAFDTYKKPLKHWLSLLKQTGTLYIFGQFNHKDIDVIVRFRNNWNNSEWQQGLCSYSINTINNFVEQLGFDMSFKRFYLGIDLPESENPVASYTKTTKDNERIVMNGANLIMEYYFLKISKN